MPHESIVLHVITEAFCQIYINVLDISDLYLLSLIIWFFGYKQEEEKTIDF